MLRGKPEGETSRRLPQAALRGCPLRGGDLGRTTLSAPLMATMAWLGPPEGSHQASTSMLRWSLTHPHFKAAMAVTRCTPQSRPVMGTVLVGVAYVSHHRDGALPHGTLSGG